MRYVPRDDGPRVYAAALAGVVHVLFFALLIFGVSWQIRSPTPVSVELWPAAPAPAQPPPAVREPPRPVQPVEPAPPPPPPRAESRPAPQQPDIALEKEKQEKAAREAAERDRKIREDQARVERERKQREEQMRQERERLEQQARRELEDADRRRLQQQLAQESQQIENDLAKTQASAADAAASDAWKARIAAKIRGNIVVPDGLAGNPEAVFDVVQLPTGEVISVKLRKSSGYKVYDEAVERAIRKASPLPRPERSSLFERDLRLTFRPQDH